MDVSYHPVTTVSVYIVQLIQGTVKCVLNLKGRYCRFVCVQLKDPTTYYNYGPDNLF